MYQTLRRGSALLIILGSIALAHCATARPCTTFDRDGNEITTSTATNGACRAMHARLDSLKTRDPGGDIIIR